MSAPRPVDALLAGGAARRPVRPAGDGGGPRRIRHRRRHHRGARGGQSPGDRVAYWQPGFAAAPRTPRRPVAAAVRGPGGAARIRPGGRGDRREGQPDVTLVALATDSDRREHVALLGELRAGRHVLTGTCRRVRHGLPAGRPRPVPRAEGAVADHRLVPGHRAAGGQPRPPGHPHRRARLAALRVDYGQPVSAVSAGPTGSRYGRLGGGEDLRVLHSDTRTRCRPSPPARSAGTGRAASRAPGIYGLDQPYASAAHARALPAIRDGVLVDLTYADRAAPMGDSLDAPMRYQVWAGPDAPAGCGAGWPPPGRPSPAPTDRRAPAAAGPFGAGPGPAAVPGRGAAGPAAGRRHGTGHRASGRPARADELAALRAVGVPRGMLRRAGFREYWPRWAPRCWSVRWRAGRAPRVMPHLPQVAAGATGPPPLWWPGVEWPVGALLTCGAVLALATVGVVGTQLRRGTPERLREGSA